MASCIAVATLLFAQFALSAYACPHFSPIASAAAASAPAPCDSTDPAEPNLCVKHCHDGAQSVEQFHSPLADSFVPAYSVTVPVRAVFHGMFMESPALSHPVSPPLTIRNCCFRI